ncbi:MAG: DUF2147 domain-containing protein [Sphingobacteriales bacterium]|jgi:uncharacterized protein (DUF2147 family)|nr:DUF2147 domain-containing protein [Sphingobacteriales bacterium]
MLRIFVLSCLLLSSSWALFASNPDAILGTWLVPEKDAQVEIYKCGAKYCAKIVWLQKPIDEKGQPRKDAKNTNAALRTRPLMNMTFLENFAYDSKANEWSGGTLYDSRSGKSYSGYIKANANGTLTLTGYALGMRWLSRSNIWTRVK